MERVVEAHDQWVIVELRDVVEIRGVAMPDIAEESQSVHLHSVGPRCPAQLRAYPKDTRVCLFGATPMTTIPGFPKLRGVLHSGIMGMIVPKDQALGTDRFVASEPAGVPSEPGVPAGIKVSNEDKKKASR